MTRTVDKNDLVLKYKKTRNAVDAALEQATQATMFHETWRPCAQDSALLARMGNSYATHSFQVIRWALRRELIMSLMRLWDGYASSLSLRQIGDSLSNDDFFSVLLEERATQMDSADTPFMEMLRGNIQGKRRQVLPLIRKYDSDGSGFQTYNLLRTLRNKRLAHHEIGERLTLTDPTDERIEEFYLDTLDIVSRLHDIVNGVACDLNEAAGMFAHYARLFWASAKGEQTEGHPNYTPPLAGVLPSP
jgi:hypothetical protein